MKSEEKLKQSYERQKRIFDEAEAQRVQNAREQLDAINKKIEKLLAQKNQLERRIDYPNEFESFASFRQKSQTLSNESKRA